MMAVFTSLKTRIFVILAVSIVSLLAVLSLVYERFLEDQVIEGAASHSALVADTIHLGLAQNMISNNREAIQLSLRDILKNPVISEIVVTDGKDRAVYASREETIGQNMKKKGFSGIGDSRGWKVAKRAEGRGREIFRYIPIPNRTACHGCHSPSQKVLGHVGLRMSLEDSERLIATSRYFLLAVATVLLVALFVVNAHFFNKHVSKPIESLLRRFEDVQNGKVVAGSEADFPADEIGVLSGRFEDLLLAVEDLHSREKEKAKEYVLLQQDRAHQEEMRDINSQLGVRVAELDKANRRINAMASQLEEKNESLQNAVKNISALNRVGVALSSELDIDKLVKLLINISVKGMRAEIGYIMLMDDEGVNLKMRSWTGLPENFEPTSTIRTGESVSGMVVKTGQPVLLPKVDGTGGIKAESRYGFVRRSVISAPIKIKGRILGVIELTNKKGSLGFNEDDLQMMQSIANQAAVALENANLYRQVQKSYFDTIRALVQAVEEKDTYTRGHSERVTTFSVKIAEKMGFSDRQILSIRYGGVLHDIGKIGINVNIIQKPGRLTDEEFNIIKNHPLIGERIISPIAFLKDVLPVVSQHHERYDGHGYPLGIDGSRMVPEARVLAVADAYDAMITARPYRSPLPREEAIAELRRCSGTQFDPIVVEFFLELLESDDAEIMELEKSAALMAAG